MLAEDHRDHSGEAECDRQTVAEERRFVGRSARVQREQMKVRRPEAGQQHTGEEHALGARRSEQQTPRADENERRIRQHVRAVRHAEEAPLVGEVTVVRIVDRQDAPEAGHVGIIAGTPASRRLNGRRPRRLGVETTPAQPPGTAALPTASPDAG
jgi:hypothetical protein